MNILKEAFVLFREMSPFLLFGFLVSGILYVLISQEWVKKHLGKSKFESVIKASFFGVPLPLCSCSVIPVAISLRKSGASLGACIAFLISTPQTGIDSIFVTYSLLGPVFAIIRPLIAFASGVAGGIVINFTNKNQTEDKDEAENISIKDKPKKNIFFRIFEYGFVTLPKDIAKPLLIGILVSGVISAIIPEDYFASYLGTGITSYIIMMILGIPIYVCATASVPIAAVLMAKGVSPGAVLVFIMTGPATNSATFTTLYKIFGKKVMIIFLLTVSLTAIFSGWILDTFFYETIKINFKKHYCAEMFPQWVGIVSSIVLAVILLRNIISFKSKKMSACCSSSENIIVFKVTGMTCMHCAKGAGEAMEEFISQNDYKINLEKSEIEFYKKDIDKENLIRVLALKGIKVEQIKGEDESCSRQ